MGEQSTTNQENNIENTIDEEIDPEKLDRKAWENLVGQMSSRFTFATPERLANIRQSASMGCSDKEISLYAEISKQTLYTWIKAYPLLGILIDYWKETPVLQARGTIMKNLTLPETAKWYLERKTKGEFANQQKNYTAEITTDNLSDIEKDNLKEMLGLDV